MSLQHFAGQLEILETRIAPATIFVGSLADNDTEYKEPPGAPGTTEDPGFVSPFFDTDAGAADPISAVVGTGAAGPDTFYLKLSKGDSLMRFTGVGYVPFITGLGGLDSSGKPIGVSGNVVAFFVDKNGNNEVDADELTGLSLGKDVSVEVRGNVDGDIVSNLNDATFALGGAGEAVGVATDLLLNPIKSLVVSGNVNGRIMSGGVINQLKVVGSVHEVLAGKAANAQPYDFNTAGIADGGDTLSVTPAAGVKGVSINNVAVGSLDKAGFPVGKVEAGGGGAGAEGGSITNLTVLTDTSGFQILAGAGGNGAAGKTSGGAGGKLSKIYINGLDENQGDDLNKNDQITIRGGEGGDALAGGKGGNGGALLDVYVGYELVNSKFLASTNALQDQVLIAGGGGGDGKSGGAGGNLTNVNVVANPTGLGNDIEILGGLGGANIEAVKGGKAGIGGSLSRIDAQNPPQDGGVPAVIKAAKIILKGGDGGATMAGFGAGAAGGSIGDAHLIGFNLDIRAGNGSNGISGGAGGNLKKIVIDEGYMGSPNTPLGVRAESAIVDAGKGGDGTVTKGANGGSITTLKINNADFKLDVPNSSFGLQVNKTAGAANGGNSFKGAGGLGGSLVDFDVVDIDAVPLPNPNNEAVIELRAGNGGTGGGGNGGNGGSFTGDNTILAVNANLILNAGIGGNATGKGNGGKGGDARGLGFFSPDPKPFEVPPTSTVGGVAASAFVKAGDGGNGAGAGAGGAGGVLFNLSLRTDGVVTATAGKGGVAGATGAAGKGGDITVFAGLSRVSSIAVTAGDAVAGGVKAAAGGKISNLSLWANTSITVEAGDGQNGGAGGGIDSVGFLNETGDISPQGVGLAVAGPGGPVTITAGTGSAMAKAAGAGGSISNVSGVIGVTGLTQIKAGGVAVIAGATKSANGGSISDINLFGGGGAGAEVRIEAGDAADVPNAKKGGSGGSVKEVQIGNLLNPSVIDPATIIRQIVAGDGGDVTIAKGIGGTGGSVTEIRVADDIGVRSGLAFGYNSAGVFNFMGGIFAGAAGTSGAGGKVAVAGNVIGISADAIASIVAGKAINGDAITRRNLVQEVDAIVLNGSVASLTNPNGTYLNFGAANIVGGVVNPGAVGVAYPAAHPHANTFDLIVQGNAVDEYGDVDGNLTFSLGDTTNANTDGFVAAVKFFNDSTTPNNVRVEALLTVLDPKNILSASNFIDLNNLNGQPHT